MELHLNSVFGKDLLNEEWMILPPLGPKQHFYPPNINFVTTEASIPLNHSEILNQLDREYCKFCTLLQSRKDCFERQQDWMHSDSSMSTSSSDSDQEFEVDAILDKEIDDDNVVWYKVTWKYYPGESTWVRESNIENAADLIQEYELENQ